MIALPAGVILGHLHRGANVAIGSSIVGRALPSLVLIGVLLTVLGIGFVNNMTALAVLATGPILTNSYDGVDGVDRDVVEAARGMGMSGRQILGRIELPLAVPLIFTGIRDLRGHRRRHGADRRDRRRRRARRRDREPGELPPRRRDRRVVLRDGALGGGLAGARCVAKSAHSQGTSGG